MKADQIRVESIISKTKIVLIKYLSSSCSGKSERQADAETDFAVGGRLNCWSNRPVKSCCDGVRCQK